MDVREQFDTIMARIAADGREEALFGVGAADALRAAQRSCAIVGCPASYSLEFPLVGDPSVDFTSIWRTDELPMSPSFFAPVEPACAPFVSWCASSPQARGCLCGCEMDVSRGNPAPAFILEPLDSARFWDATSGMLCALGEGERLAGVRDVLARLPEGWQPWYCGIFGGRPQAPTRLALLPDATCLDRLADILSSLGVPMETRMRQMIEEGCARVPGLFREIQLDLLPGGVLAPSLGCVGSLTKPGLRVWDAVLAEEIVALGRQWGLADGRWALVEGACLAQGVCVWGDSGPARLLMRSVPTWIKLKWRDGKALPMKCYLDVSVRISKGSKR